jgi:hypothetical protein
MLISYRVILCVWVGERRVGDACPSAAPYL